MQQNKILKGILNDEEKTALAFLQDSITKTNTDNYNLLTLAHARPNKLILNLNIDQLKSILSNIIPTLKVKKETENILENYTGLLKNAFIKRLKIATTQYNYSLKTICNNPNYDEMNHNLSKINSTDIFKSIINAIKYYNNIMQRLNNDDKRALIFIQDSITKFNPNNPKDQSIITNIQDNLRTLISQLSIDTPALSNIRRTLKTKKEAEDSLENYNNPLKDILTKILKDASIKLTDLLINICNTINYYEFYHNLSKINNADIFKNIINTIKHYNNVIEQLSNDEKEALTFLKDSATKPNPDDPNDHSIITNIQENLHKLILNLSIDQLKSILSNIIPTLKAKKEAEDSLENYNDPLKNTFIKRLKNASTQFKYFLKNICNTSNFDEIHQNLSTTNNANVFENIINTIKHYNNVIKQHLNNDEKEALVLLGNSISKEIKRINKFMIIEQQISLNKLILNLSIDQLKSILSNIILILNTKKEAEDSLKNYNGPLKNTFTKKLENATIQFIELLKKTYNISNFDAMYHNLSITNAYLFKDITRNIEDYNNVIKQLNNEEQETLTFLQHSITKPNPDDPNDHNIITNTQASLTKLILNLSIDKLKSILSNIMPTLKAKKEAEDSLTNYNHPLKNTLTKKLEDVTTQVINTLKSIYNTPNFDEIDHNLSTTNNTAHLFESVASDIKNYNNIIKQLNDDEKRALTSLANLITKPNPNVPNDHNIITHAQANLHKLILNSDIDKLKSILSNIRLTLKAKIYAENSIINHDDPLKYTLTKVLEDATTHYIQYLKTTCINPNFDEIYRNLLTTNNTAHLFEAIASDIKDYNNVIKQLNDDEKEALTFLQHSIIKPNPDDLDAYITIFYDEQEKFNNLILNLKLARIKVILLNIKLTLKAKKEAEDSLKNYNRPLLKNTFIQILKTATTQYIYNLKNMYFWTNEIVSNASETNDIHIFKSIAKVIQYYNNNIEKLNDDEKEALIFLQYSITKPNPDDPNDYSIIINAQANLHKVILNFNIYELKSILSKIILTLKAKKEVKDALTNYSGLLKNTFTKKLEESTTQFANLLKNICNNAPDIDEMYNNLSTTNNANVFEAIASDIKNYNNIIEQLNDDEKGALTSLANLITKPNPDDSDEHNIITHAQTNLYRLILNLDIDKLKKAISGIVITLDAKKDVEDSLKVYTGLLKDTLTKMLKDTTTSYENHLKRICNTPDFDEMYNNLLTTNNANVFEAIASDIKNYNNIIEQLNDNEKGALTSLANLITKPNPNVPNDHNIITHAQENLYKLILNFDIDKLKKAISGIVITLDAKKDVEDSLKDYNEPLKYTLTKMLKNTTTSYENHLKRICNTPDFDEMYNNLLTTNNANIFENIVSMIKSHNNIIEQLNDDEKETLTFLQYSITKPNPDDSDEHNIITYVQENLYRLILNLDIDKLKKAISDIVITLKAKKDVEDSLKDYNGPLKDTLTKMLKDTITSYENHLKRICNTPDFDEMYNNLSTTNNANVFENIVSIIKNYNNIIEQLNDDEKGALTFLQHSITQPNPDDSDEHNIIPHAQTNLYRLILNLDIDKLKKAISGIVITLNEKKDIKDSLKDYNEPLKYTLTKMLKYITTLYENHLKRICNTPDFDEMYNNLSTTNNANVFEPIVSIIKDYNNVIKQLNDDEKEALTFLQHSITQPNPDDSDEHNIIPHAQTNLYRLILNLDIDKLKKAISGIVITLDAKKEAEDSLKVYTGPSKDILTNKLKYETILYENHLKSICNKFYPDEIYNNLSTTTNYASQFKIV
ncbi:hypothetical protein bpSLO_001255 (plasmid) [Borrelia parkeri]|uniref:BTA121 domain-containing protein surface lipoprotein n=1 Tax=Borrelia parkeri TaxID=141 RepID=UPI001FF3B303|nr:hypothetical protein [Borrelia parkeri]UPA11397.1 hypothetical protein bpSLO_001255 [Borrelia parkeri]